MQKIIVTKKAKCELCGHKIKGSGEGYPEPIPDGPIALCIPCRIAAQKRARIDPVKILKNNA